MVLLRGLIVTAAKTLARDPRVQAKALELLRSEVQPRAAAAWRQAAPRLHAAEAEVRRMVREIDPGTRSGRLAGRIKKRFQDGTGRR